MSEKGSAKKARGKDRRVERTRNALGDALIALMQERPFADITVKEVLRRARVGRSAFYTHFRNKEDLFLSDVDDFFGMMAGFLESRRDTSLRVAPLEEMLAHVRDMREFLRAVADSGKIYDVMELGEAHFARGIERRLKVMAPALELPPGSRALVARALAASFIALTMGWIRGGMRESPAELDRLFHALAWRGVAGIRESRKA